MNRITIVAVIVTLLALVWGVQMLTQSHVRLAPTNVSSNSSPTPFTSSQPSNVSTGFNADSPDCSNYTPTAEEAAEGIRTLIQLRNEASGLTYEFSSQQRAEQFAAAAKLSIGDARACGKYTNEQLRLTKSDLESLGLKP